MSRTQSFVAFGLALVGLAGTPAVFAQNLEMAQPPAATTNVAAPGRGMTMAQVEKQFGAPAERYRRGRPAADHSLGLPGQGRLLRVRPRRPRGRSSARKPAAHADPGPH